MMQTMTSREVQKNFGAVIDAATAGQPICVTRYGRPGVFVIADTEESRQLVRQLAGRQLMRDLRAVPRSPEAEALSQQALNQLIDDCFA
ncbi:type II toxin-antitoxin system Phd/YefM family antitoxin [Ottowia testudinis]|uniref:Antitoxin n=1 Tax=Ottowia testudinis TaxID=2816950 RepID=A0A975H7A3_9BURK|nr:type II toxin-antitoxin system prevent-host-death family antitoxin [Ottowia testudinis]QTD46832.1 type II toxin-antitoxin system prevent-host-death family antitoxin [Ottowia testudinis]